MNCAQENDESACERRFIPRSQKRILLQKDHEEHFSQTLLKMYLLDITVCTRTSRGRSEQDSTCYHEAYQEKPDLKVMVIYTELSRRGP